jgi:two-component system, cell cycle sensor histidine kinase and response regulator CckA
VPDTNSETILLVEDEPAVRGLARQILRMHGYVVLEAADGVEALRLADAQAGPIDLLITDVIMPAMGGVPLAERLVARRPETKVLFTSGYPEDAVVQHGIPRTLVAFLQKPFTPAGLAQKVREVLGRPRPV